MVLFNGKLLADGTPAEIMQNETVQSAYLGGLYNE
jgi:branched-chain amino acid transport system ATP-binding protein